MLNRIIPQVYTAPFGSIFITGSAVNLLLVISVMTCGLASGMSSVLQLITALIGGATAAAVLPIL